jgi:hypothetical protein
MKQSRMHSILAKAFPSLEVVEAKKPLQLFPTQEDWDTAVPKDPEHCGFANCAHRVCGATQAHFFKKYVYIDHVGDDGIRRVHRYVVSPGVYRAIAVFDETEKMREKPRAFILRPPSSAETLHGARARNRRWSQGMMGQAVKAEQKSRTELRRSERELKQAIELVKKADVVRGSAKAKELDRRVTAAQQQVRKAQTAVEVTAERVAKARKLGYRPMTKTKVRTHNITIRSGTGAWLRKLSGKAETGQG